MNKAPWRAALTAVLVGMALVSAAPVQAATLTVNGTVTCAGGRAVAGVWVQSSGGGSKWANWSKTATNKASYSATLSTAVPTNVQLHVGCDKNGDGSWWSNNRTNNTRLSGSATRNVTCNEAAGTGTRCTYTVSGTNPFGSGWCTSGMATKWFEQTGAWPTWRGDAKYWDTEARNAGWTMSATPRTRSILVIEPGPWPLSSASEGHVAWVNRVNRDSNGKIVSLNITDMNGKGGFGKWWTGDRPYKSSGMNFVYAP